MGVFAPLVGIVGATQAAEALKLIAGVGESLAGRLLLVDALTMQWREVRVPRDPGCRGLRVGSRMMRLVGALARRRARSARMRRRRQRCTTAGHGMEGDPAGDRRTAAALKAGDGGKAMTYAVPDLRAQFRTPDHFLAMVRHGYRALLDARASTFLKGAVVDGATIQPLQLVLPDNTVQVALYQMRRQKDGRWRIAGCVIAPSTAQAI